MGRHSETPPHLAAERGLEAMAHMMVENGADPFVKNDAGLTAADIKKETKKKAWSMGHRDRFFAG